MNPNPKPSSEPTGSDVPAKQEKVDALATPEAKAEIAVAQEAESKLAELVGGDEVLANTLKTRVQELINSEPKPTREDIKILLLKDKKISGLNSDQQELLLDLLMGEEAVAETAPATDGEEDPENTEKVLGHELLGVEIRDVKRFSPGVDMPAELVSGPITEKTLQLLAERGEDIQALVDAYKKTDGETKETTPKKVPEFKDGLNLSEYFEGKSVEEIEDILLNQDDHPLDLAFSKLNKLPGLDSFIKSQAESIHAGKEFSSEALTDWYSEIMVQYSAELEGALGQDFEPTLENFHKVLHELGEAGVLDKSLFMLDYQGDKEKSNSTPEADYSKPESFKGMPVEKIKEILQTAPMIATLNTISPDGALGFDEFSKFPAKDILINALAEDLVNGEITDQAYQKWYDELLDEHKDRLEEALGKDFKPTKENATQMFVALWKAGEITIKPQSETTESTQGPEAQTNRAPDISEDIQRVTAILQIENGEERTTKLKEWFQETDPETIARVLLEENSPLAPGFKEYIDRIPDKQKFLEFLIADLKENSDVSSYGELYNVFFQKTLPKYAKHLVTTYPLFGKRFQGRERISASDVLNESQDFDFKTPEQKFDEAIKGLKNVLPEGYLKIIEGKTEGDTVLHKLGQEAREELENGADPQQVEFKVLRGLFDELSNGSPGFKEQVSAIEGFNPNRTEHLRALFRSMKERKPINKESFSTALQAEAEQSQVEQGPQPNKFTKMPEFKFSRAEIAELRNAGKSAASKEDQEAFRKDAIQRAIEEKLISIYESKYNTWVDHQFNLKAEKVAKAEAKAQAKAQGEETGERTSRGPLEFASEAIGGHLSQNFEAIGKILPKNFPKDLTGFLGQGNAKQIQDLDLPIGVLKARASELIKAEVEKQVGAMEMEELEELVFANGPLVINPAYLDMEPEQLEAEKARLIQKKDFEALGRLNQTLAYKKALEAVPGWAASFPDDGSKTYATMFAEYLRTDKGFLNQNPESPDFDITKVNGAEMWNEWLGKVQIQNEKGLDGLKRLIHMVLNFLREVGILDEDEDQKDAKKKFLQEQGIELTEEEKHKRNARSVAQEIDDVDAVIAGMGGGKEVATSRLAEKFETKEELENFRARILKSEDATIIGLRTENLDVDTLLEMEKLSGTNPEYFEYSENALTIKEPNMPELNLKFPEDRQVLKDYVAKDLNVREFVADQFVTVQKELDDPDVARLPEGIRGSELDSMGFMELDGDKDFQWTEHMTQLLQLSEEGWAGVEKHDLQMISDGLKGDLTIEDANPEGVTIKIGKEGESMTYNSIKDVALAVDPRTSEFVSESLGGETTFAGLSIAELEKMGLVVEETVEVEEPEKEEPDDTKEEPPKEEKEEKKDDEAEGDGDKDEKGETDEDKEGKGDEEEGDDTKKEGEEDKGEKGEEESSKATDDEEKKGDEDSGSAEAPPDKEKATEKTTKETGKIVWKEGFQDILDAKLWSEGNMPDKAELEFISKGLDTDGFAKNYVEYQQKGYGEKLGGVSMSKAMGEYQLVKADGSLKDGVDTIIRDVWKDGNVPAESEIQFVAGKLELEGFVDNYRAYEKKHKENLGISMEEAIEDQLLTEDGKERYLSLYNKSEAFQSKTLSKEERAFIGANIEKDGFVENYVNFGNMKDRIKGGEMHMLAEVDLVTASGKPSKNFEALVGPNYACDGGHRGAQKYIWGDGISAESIPTLATKLATATTVETKNPMLGADNSYIEINEDSKQRYAKVKDLVGETNEEIPDSPKVAGTPKASESESSTAETTSTEAVTSTDAQTTTETTESTAETTTTEPTTETTEKLAETTPESDETTTTETTVTDATAAKSSETTTE